MPKIERLPVNLAMQLKDLDGKAPAHLVDNVHFVDEYFTITPDGGMTRTFKPGTVRTLDWFAPQNLTVQELGLTGMSIEIKNTKAPVPPNATKISPIWLKIVTTPVNRDSQFGSFSRRWTPMDADTADFRRLLASSAGGALQQM